MDKSEFERRAAEMRARNLEQSRLRKLPPPRSVFAPPLPTPGPAKVNIRDFLSDADLSDLSEPLAAIRKLRTLETDRDGLLDLSEAGVDISVSPELLPRGIRVYESCLKAFEERNWATQTEDGRKLRVVICDQPLELSVTEKTDPIPEVMIRPGERRPRRPAGSLEIASSGKSVGDGERQRAVSVRNRRNLLQVESKDRC